MDIIIHKCKDYVAKEDVLPYKRFLLTSTRKFENINKGYILNTNNIL